MKTRVKRIALIMLSLCIMLSLSACLDPISLIPDLSFNITGRIDFNDITAAAFIITNLSKTIDVSLIDIDQPDWRPGESLPADGPFSASITGRPRAGQRNASYLTNSDENYDAAIAFTVWNDANSRAPDTQDTARSGTFVSTLNYQRDTAKWNTVNGANVQAYIYNELNFLLLNARDAIEFFIYRDVNGDVRITHLTYSGGIPDGDRGMHILIDYDHNDTVNLNVNLGSGGGSSPAFIRIADNRTLAPFIMVNNSLDTDIDMVVFRNTGNNNTYTIGSLNYAPGHFSGIRANNRRSIALEIGASFEVTVYANGETHPFRLNTTINVFSGLDQQSINNVLYFYKSWEPVNNLWVSHTWPPQSTPAPDAENLLPPKDNDKRVDSHINSALLLITNLSRTTHVDSVFITQQVMIDNLPETRTVAQFTGAPGSLQTKSQYLAPSPIPYNVQVRVNGQEGPLLNTNVILANAREIAELFIYQDVNGNFVIVNRLNFFDINHPPKEDDLGKPGDLNDPFEGEGSIPAVIPSANRGGIGTFIVVNMTNSMNISSVTMRSAANRPTYTIRDDPLLNQVGVAVRAQSQRSIGLSQGDWQVDVEYFMNGQYHKPLHNLRNITIVPSNDPQTPREHYIYFYLNNQGDYVITNDPNPPDRHPEDIMPPDNGQGRGLLSITNNSRSLVTAVAIFNERRQELPPMYIDGEITPSTGSRFAPPRYIGQGENGFVRVIGTTAFPIDPHGEYLIRVFLVSSEGEATVDQLAWIKDNVTRIIITDDDIVIWNGCPDCANKPGGCDCLPGGGCNCIPPTTPPGCGCDGNNPDCDCGINCECPPGQCDCGDPNNNCCGDDCTCVGTCECTGPGNGCKCPEPDIPDPTPLYNFDMSRNTMIDTGVAIRDGQVFVWGYIYAGAAGNGYTAQSYQTTPRAVQGLSGIVEVAGSAHSLVARNAAGEAWGWGQNLHGAAGVGVTRDRIVYTPQRIRFPNNEDVRLVQIEAGEYFFIARDTLGRVWTWGHNNYGQIGAGTAGNRVTPVRIPLGANGNETARLVGASYEGAFAVTTNNVYAWGRNIQGSLGIPSTIVSVSHNSPQVASHLNGIRSRIVQISGGYLHGHALLDDGTVVGWGQNDHIGGNGTGRQNTPVTIIGRPGASHVTTPRVMLESGDVVTQLHSRFISTIVLTQTGRVFTWGTEGYNVGGGVSLSPAGRPVQERFTANEQRVSQIGGGKHHVYYGSVSTGNPSQFFFYGVGYGAGYKFLEFPSAGNRNWPGRGLPLN